MREVFAALDTGSARNGCALAVFGRARGLYIPLALKQWLPRPGIPLDLRLVVLPEAARIVKGLGCDGWGSDSYAISDVKIVASEHGLTTIVPPPEQWETWRHIWTATNRERLALSPTGIDKMPDDETLRTLRSQLASVIRKPGAKGTWNVVIPETDDGLHGDLAMAAARSLWMARAADAEFVSTVKIDVSRLGGRSRYDTSARPGMGMQVNVDQRRQRRWA